MAARLAFSPCLPLRASTARFAVNSAVPATTRVRPLWFSASAQQADPAAAAAKPVRRMPAIIRPVVPDPRLFEFDIEDRAQLRSDVLRRLSDYVKEHNLQDADNKRIVKCDAKLEKLLGVPECTILQISKYVSPYLKKPDVVGGRYIEEARLVELEWERNNPPKENDEPKSKRRSRRASQASETDKAVQRKIFKPVILSDDLAAICRAKEMPRQQIIKAIWEYIHMNNLKGEPGQPIRCDFLLKKVYDADTIDVKSIMKGISKHVTKKD